VLDVAAAQGNFSLTLAELGYRLTWNDLREELADYVRLKYERGDIRFMVGNILALPPVQHDLVLATEIIEHVAHPDHLLSQLVRFIRPGGYLVLTTPNGAYLGNRLPRFSDFDDTSAFEARQFRPDADGHIFLLSPDELCDLAHQAGLAAVEVKCFSTPITAGWLGTERVGRRLPDGNALVQRAPRSVRNRLTIHLAGLFRRT
jgi:2-polyprenyl-6-hydroxyphenyl methylase/3-demethylubiquinone-9 3-methyltransferase